MDNEYNTTSGATDTTNQLRASVMVASASQARIEVKNRRRENVIQTWDQYPRSKAARRSWKNKNAKVFENTSQETNEEGLSHPIPTSLPASGAPGASMSGSTQLEGGDSATTMTVATFSSANITTATPASGNMPELPSIPTTSNQSQTILVPTWRIIRLGPAPAPTPVAAAVQLHVVSETVHEDADSPKQKISTESKPGKENKPHESVPAVPTRRSARIMKKLPARSTRGAHPQAVSSSSGTAVESASPA